MAKVNIPAEVKDFERVMSGLRRIDPNIMVRKLNLAQMDQMLKDMISLNRRAFEVDREADAVQIQREQLAKKFHEICKQARAKVKGDYGDDAPELEMVGVMRISQIVRNRRKKAKGDAKSDASSTDSTKETKET